MKFLFNLGLAVGTWLVIIGIVNLLWSCNKDEAVCVFAGCAKPTEREFIVKQVNVPGKDGKDGIGCYTVEHPEKLEIVCDAEITTILKPQDGKDGATGPIGPAGPAGSNGTSGATGAQGEKGDTGASGPTGADGSQGPQGDPGMVGNTGATGPAGEGCTIEQQTVGALITCGDNAVLITNGIDGINGQDAAPATNTYLITEIIDPCGNTGGPDEILLKLADGTYVAWYFNVGLSVLAPGNYQTTDSSHCPFTIDINGEYSE